MRIQVCALLALMGACAPEYNITHDPAGQPQAGRVAVSAQPIKADVVAVYSPKLKCGSALDVCLGTRKAIKDRTGANWSWSTPCAAETWQAQAPGGRTLVAYHWNSALAQEEYFVYPSQSKAFSVQCWCGPKFGCSTYWNE